MLLLLLLLLAFILFTLTTTLERLNATMGVPLATMVASNCARLATIRCADMERAVELALVLPSGA